MGTDPGQNLLFLERFIDVVHPSGFKGVNLVLGLTQGTNKDNRNILDLITLFDRLTDLIAVHLRHNNIQQNQIWADGLQLLQSKLTIR